jgi:hypothetical protein
MILILKNLGVCTKQVLVFSLRELQERRLFICIWKNACEEFLVEMEVAK